MTHTVQAPHILTNLIGIEQRRDLAEGCVIPTGVVDGGLDAGDHRVPAAQLGLQGVTFRHHLFVGALGIEKGEGKSCLPRPMGPT